MNFYKNFLVTYLKSERYVLEYYQSKFYIVTVNK